MRLVFLWPLAAFCLVALGDAPAQLFFRGNVPKPNSLTYSACTQNSNRMILCINDCTTDQTLDLSKDVMYSTKQVVLDFSTETLDTPGEKDLPIHWYDKFCPKQPSA